MSVRRWVGVLLGALAVVALGASPASAHAVLEETTPPSGQAVETSPKTVTLRFTEPVSVSLGGVRVLDAEGGRVDTGKSGHSGNTVSVPVKSLADGRYVVAYRVISADSHPIKGAFTFRVGAAAEGDDRQLIQDLLASEGNSGGAVGGLYGIARFGAFTGLTLLVGGGLFVALCWAAGVGSDRVRRVLWGAWGLTFVSTVGGIIMQGPYAAGLGVADGFKPSLIGDVLETRFGTVWGIRLGLLVLAVPFLLVVRAGRATWPRWWGPGGAVVSLALLLTPGAAGHAATGELVPLAMIADVVHLGAIAFWLGGLVMLCVALLREPDSPAMRAAVPLFSKLALFAVATILVSGTFQSWRQIRELDALTSTDYGKLVLIKLGLFSVIMGIAYFSRQVVRGRLGGAVPVPVPGPGTMAASDPEMVGRLRRSVLGEVGLVAVVLVVTSLLVNTVPGREALAKPFSALIETKEMLIDVTVEPAKAGPNDIHFYTLDATGAVKAVPTLEATLTLKAQDIGPLPVKLTRITGDHYSVYGQDIPIPGEWTLEVTARPTEFDQIKGSTTFRVR